MPPKISRKNNGIILPQTGGNVQQKVTEQWKRTARIPHEGGLSNKVKDVKPRRNYWGNLDDDDTFDENENIMSTEDYDYSDFDVEDDHDSYYDMID